ncbi:MAG: c-type cytochrome [Ignavibacteria bacterium]|jgi:cytochrome c oxidase cbb3-type subunit 3|nr:c-type cytochrome [Ignavibacteria bacterium]MCU7519774.1 c-type cytochrome [Ignavibacteria bacterium]
MVKTIPDIKARRNNYSSIVFIVLTGLITLLNYVNTFSQDAAQQASPQEEMNWGSYAKWASVLLGILIFVILIITLVYGNRPEVEAGEKKFFFKRLVSRISAAAPLEEEKDIMMEDNYDGIRELNNKIPPWFNILFYGSILFAAIYLMVFHVFGSGQVSQDEYQSEVQEAELQKEILFRQGKLVTEANVEELKDAGSLLSGKETFMAKCSVCHGRAGEGVVGPNLTDDYWIHGAGIKNVFKVIKNGVQQKGMPTWDGQLSPKQIQEVASYVISIHGTNPPNAKAPQGVLVKPSDESSRDSANTMVKK